jgi:ribosomal protein S18 acetylase RimI-like enzyme
MSGYEREYIGKVGMEMVNDVVIRPINESDAPSIHAVALEAWMHTYRTIFNQQFIQDFVNRNYAPETILSLFSGIQAGSIFFDVAECGSKVIGFCNIGITKQGAELYRIYLLPAFIGQGIGRRLLERGEEFVVKHGMDLYFCFVHKNNEIGKQFYLKYGFKHISAKDKDDEWFMEKSLSNI